MLQKRTVCGETRPYGEVRGPNCTVCTVESLDLELIGAASRSYAKLHELASSRDCFRAAKKEEDALLADGGQAAQNCIKIYRAWKLLGLKIYTAP